MTKKALNRLIFAVILGIFIITGFVLYYALTMKAPVEAEGAYNGHEVQAYDHTAEEQHETLPSAEHEVPAYEEPIHDLTEAVEAAKEDVAEDLAEGENPLAAEVAPEEITYECDFDAWVGEMVTGLELDTFDRPYRVLEPGAMYTTDHVPERINIHVDEHGEVVGVTCG